MVPDLNEHFEVLANNSRHSHHSDCSSSIDPTVTRATSTERACLARRSRSERKQAVYDLNRPNCCLGPPGAGRDAVQGHLSRARTEASLRLRDVTPDPEYAAVVCSYVCCDRAACISLRRVCCISAACVSVTVECCPAVSTEAVSSLRGGARTETHLPALCD